MKNSNVVYSSTNTNKIRRGLMIIAPFCFWCDKKLTDDHDFYMKNGLLHEEVPDNLAVIDHIMKRTTKQFRRLNYSPKVLACYRCDKTRSKSNTKKSTVKEEIEIWRKVLSSSK